MVRIIFGAIVLFALLSYPAEANSPAGSVPSPLARPELALAPARVPELYNLTERTRTKTQQACVLRQGIAKCQFIIMLCQQPSGSYYAAKFSLDGSFDLMVQDADSRMIYTDARHNGDLSAVRPELAAAPGHEAEVNVALKAKQALIRADIAVGAPESRRAYAAAVDELIDCLISADTVRR